jgi:DNA-binding MarR family transcriptional regulator
MPKCSKCGQRNPGQNIFCDGCGSSLKLKPEVGGSPIQPIHSYSLTSFDDDILSKIFDGYRWLPTIAEQCGVTQETMFSRVRQLEAGGLVKISRVFPYWGGKVNVHLTPEGYNRARQVSPNERPSGDLAAAPMQQSVSVKQGGDGWKVCGYACLILVIFIVILTVFAGYSVAYIIGWIMHLLGLS